MGSEVSTEISALPPRPPEAEIEGSLRWRVGSRIASGGMGEVRQAFDELLRREVAIKTLHPGSRDARNRAALFLEEARIPIAWPLSAANSEGL